MIRIVMQEQLDGITVGSIFHCTWRLVTTKMYGFIFLGADFLRAPRAPEIAWPSPADHRAKRPSIKRSSSCSQPRRTGRETLEHPDQLQHPPK